MLGGCISTAANVQTRQKYVWKKNLSGRFEDWMFKECQIKKTINLQL